MISPRELAGDAAPHPGPGGHDEHLERMCLIKDLRSGFYDRTPSLKMSALERREYLEIKRKQTEAKPSDERRFVPCKKAQGGHSTQSINPAEECMCAVL